MSVSFARAVADGLRAHGIPVHFWSGWETRGNGMTSAYEGEIVHHTASAYGSAFPMLVTGRSDLSGPLCNSAGNDDGSVTIIAAHPANHAGASGGRSMGPLPVTRSFNKYVWGHEIVYPGTSPMTAAQHHTALVLGGVIGGILRRPNAEWIRAHAETSITGKYDPGYAPGRTIDMHAFRAEIWPAMQAGGSTAPAPAPVQEVDVTPEQDAILRRIDAEIMGPWKDGRPSGWSTAVGPRTHTAMLVELLNSLKGLRSSRYPGSTVQFTLEDAIMDSNSADFQVLASLAGLKASNEALVRSIAELASTDEPELDVDLLISEVEQAAERGVARAVSEGLDVELSITNAHSGVSASSIEEGSVQAERDSLAE